MVKMLTHENVEAQNFQISKFKNLQEKPSNPSESLEFVINQIL